MQKGYCFFARGHIYHRPPGDGGPSSDPNHIFFEDNWYLELYREKNCLVRSFFSKEDIDSGRTPIDAAKQGLHLVATDTPEVLGCRGVFLADCVAKPEPDEYQDRGAKDTSNPFPQMV